MAASSSVSSGATTSTLNRPSTHLMWAACAALASCSAAAEAQGARAGGEQQAEPAASGAVQYSACSAVAAGHARSGPAQPAGRPAVRPLPQEWLTQLPLDALLQLVHRVQELLSSTGRRSQLGLQAHQAFVQQVVDDLRQARAALQVRRGGALLECPGSRRSRRGNAGAGVRAWELSSSGSTVCQRAQAATWTHLLGKLGRGDGVEHLGSRAGPALDRWVRGGGVAKQALRQESGASLLQASPS